MAAKNGGSNFWGKFPVDSAYTLWVENLFEIALSRTVSEINALLRFTQKFKMAAKSGGKAIFDKGHQYSSRLCIYPVGQKFCQDRSI